VRICGKDVRSYALEELRQFVGVVPQRASLVTGTIADNLRWGNPDADTAELEQACKIAQAWEFVSQTPQGLETPVTQGGRSLSGGQKQRLTIARAMVGAPKLLILDDSMSALDYATDLALRRALAEKMQDVTKIVISQRATSIQHADHILVMEDGKCVGYGTHEELLVQCPVYAEIFQTQMQ
jgi:ATP-binding cassette subfamily B multidrug efflux pump